MMATIFSRTTGAAAAVQQLSSSSCSPFFQRSLSSLFHSVGPPGGLHLTTLLERKRSVRSLSFHNLVPVSVPGSSTSFHTCTLKCMSKDSGSGAKSLADSILSAKQEEQKKENGDGAGEGASGGKKGSEENSGGGPKPLTKWQKIGYWFFGLSMIGGIVVNAVVFSLPDQDENGNNVEDEFSSYPFYSQYFCRLKNKIFKTKKDFEEPFSDKLLPDPLPEPYHQPKYTVLIELTGLLVHANWTHKHGWRFQKRPGVDIFLSQIGYPNFELVVYTAENAMTFYPIVDGLDPNQQFIMYRLFRDATRYVNGSHVKDLGALNRDLKKVIVVDWNKNSVQLNSENGLILQKWEGDNSDKSLIGLAQLLNAIRTSDVDDVREVLEYYKQFEDPIEAFRENQRKLETEMLAEEEKRNLQHQKKKTSLLSGLSASFRRT